MNSTNKSSPIFIRLSIKFINLAMGAVFWDVRQGFTPGVGDFPTGSLRIMISRAIKTDILRAS